MYQRNKPHTVESLLERTRQNGDCKEWTGACRSNGYGVTVYKGTGTTTHRVMYELIHGEVNPDMEIDHTCNNRKCINPDHLQLVDHKTNMLLARNRRKTCKKGHEWNEKNTYEYKGGRFCRKCRAEYQAKLRSTGLNNKGGLVR